MTLIWALAAGLGLGLAYFVGLWFTVQRMPTSNHPMALAMGSFMLRLMLIMLGLYWVADGDWQRMILALGGVLIARWVMTKTLGVAKAEGIEEAAQ
jgi:F1F0 ATPase subunit 2